MKRVYQTVGALVVAVAILAGGIAAAEYGYYASAQTPTQTPSNPSTPNLDQQQRSPIVGSVKVPSRASTLVSLAKIDIIKAIAAATAQQSGTVLAANLDERNSSLVYQVVILTADGSAVLVTVDAGNGNILNVAKLPMEGEFGHGRRGGHGR